MKNENPTLLRKLKAYSAMAGSIVAVAGTANAQAFYTDIDPDVTISESEGMYLLDLNNDGTIDFGVGFHKHAYSENGVDYYYTKIFAKPYNGGSIAGDADGAYVFPFALGAGDLIGANPNDWQDGTSQTMVAAKAYAIISSSNTSAISAAGEFYGGANKFLPLRFKIGSDTHYGWARFDIPNLVNSFTIRDYAYNQNPSDGLFAGQGDPTDIQITPAPESIKIFAYDGVLNTLLINQKIDHASLVITNMMGQQVKVTNLANASTRLDVSDLPFGIYMVAVTNGGQTFNQKVALRK